MKTDIIVIGAGPGGMEAALMGIRMGKQVVVIERDHVGGTCLNCGCIPTKALCHSADVANTLREAAEVGVKISDDVSLDFSVAVQRKNRIVAGLRENVEAMLSAATIVRGEARLMPGGVIVGEESYEAPTIIIATGSTPATLPIDGAEYAIDSTALLDMQALPEDIVIIGGGVIGMEFASILSSFNVKVTVIEYATEILPSFDRETAKRLRSLMTRRGVKIITGSAVTAISPDFTVTYQSKGKDQMVKAGAVLMAVGRKPVIPAGADEIGLKIGKRGIEVDENFRTSIPGIYAIGDVNGRMMLAHVAESQARAIFGENQNPDVVPADVFTSPECSMVGMTEEACKSADGLNYKVIKSLYRANGKAMAMGEPDGFVKLIVNTDNREILGCHIIGAHAADIIQEVATVMANGLTVDAISRTIHAHPTLTELVMAASLQA